MQQYDLGKFVRLRQRVDALNGADRAASDNLEHEIRARQDLEIQATRERHGPALYQPAGRTADGRGHTEEHVSGAGKVNPATEQDLQRAIEAVAAARAHREQLNAERKPLIALVRRLEEFLVDEKVDMKRLPFPRPLTPAAGPVPALDELEALRAEIASVASQVERLASAAPTEAEVFKGIDAWLAQAAERAVPHLNVGKDGGVTVTLLELGAGSDFVHEQPQTKAHRFGLIEAWLATLAPDALREQLRVRAGEWAAKRGGWGLPKAEREAALAKLTRTLFDLEVGEELTITRFERGGFPVARRADADPRAVLALDVAVAVTA